MINARRIFIKTRKAPGDLYNIYFKFELLFINYVKGQRLQVDYNTQAVRKFRNTCIKFLKSENS